MFVTLPSYPPRAKQMSWIDPASPRFLSLRSSGSTSTSSGTSSASHAGAAAFSLHQSASQRQVRAAAETAVLCTPVEWPSRNSSQGQVEQELIELLSPAPEHHDSMEGEVFDTMATSMALAGVPTEHGASQQLFMLDCLQPALPLREQPSHDEDMIAVSMALSFMCLGEDEDMHHSGAGLRSRRSSNLPAVAGPPEHDLRDSESAAKVHWPLEPAAITAAVPSAGQADNADAAVSHAFSMDLDRPLTSLFSMPLSLFPLGSMAMSVRLEDLPAVPPICAAEVARALDAALAASVPEAAAPADQIVTAVDLQQYTAQHQAEATAEAAAAAACAAMLAAQPHTPWNPPSARPASPLPSAAEQAISQSSPWQSSQPSGSGTPAQPSSSALVPECSSDEPAGPSSRTRAKRKTKSSGGQSRKQARGAAQGSSEQEKADKELARRQKNRLIQQKYSKNKQARVAAVFEREAELRQRMATLEAELEALQAREVELLQQQPQQSISAAQEEERSAAASSQGAHAAFDSQSLNWDHIVDQMQLTSGQIAALLQHFQNYTRQLSRTMPQCQASAQQLQATVPCTHSTYDYISNYVSSMEAREKLNEAVNLQQALLASFTDACRQVLGQEVTQALQGLPVPLRITVQEICAAVARRLQ